MSSTRRIATFCEARASISLRYALLGLLAEHTLKLFLLSTLDVEDAWKMLERLDSTGSAGQ